MNKPTNDKKKGPVVKEMKMPKNKEGKRRAVIDIGEPLKGAECALCKRKTSRVIRGIASPFVIRLCDRCIVLLVQKTKFWKWFKNALETIERNDKTIYTYHGKERADRDGNLPADSDRRWLTPRELAKNYLQLLSEECDAILPKGKGENWNEKNLD